LLISYISLTIQIKIQRKEPKMKRFLCCVIALVAVAGMGVSATVEANFSNVIQQGTNYVVTCTADIPWTMNGNDITSVMIFESGSEGQVSVDYPHALVPGGVSVLSDTLDFLPTAALIIGVEDTTPLFGTGKRHLMFFVNDAFAASVSGEEFSQAFQPLHEQAFIDYLLSAETPDMTKLATLEDYFMEGGLLRPAAFTPGGSFTVIESSTITPVPEPSTLLLLGAGLAGVTLLRRRFKE
jgi:hypothetical protein